MKLNVPEALKVLLVDDWEAITKNNQVGCSSAHHIYPSVNATIQLVPLPRSPNVVEILKEFEQYILNEPKPKCAFHSRLFSTGMYSLHTSPAYVIPRLSCPR